MARRFRYRNTLGSRVAWRLLGLICVLIFAATIFTWWQGGRWDLGAMPTHGLIPTATSAAVGFVLIILKGALDRR